MKKIKLKSILLTALLFVFILPDVSLALSNETKTSSEVNGFDSNIINNSLAVSPDEKTAIVSDSREQSLLVYDLAKGTLRKEIKGFVTPRNIIFIDSGTEFVVSDSTLGTLRFYNSKTLTLKDEVVVGQGVFGTAVSPDGRTMYLNNQANSTVTIVDLETRKPTSVITGFAQPRQGIVVSPDGNYVYVTNFSGDKVSIINTATKQIVREITGFSKIRAISVTSDGDTLYAANSGRNSISMVDIAQGKIIDEIKVGQDPYGAALSPDGKLLFASNKMDNTINVISVPNNNVIGTIEGFNEPRQAIIFSKDSKRAYVLNHDLSISLVDVNTRTITNTIHDNRQDKANQYKLQVLKSEKVGKYLADAQGMTLYYFTKDESNVSNCNSKCLEIWPAFYAENIVAPGGFNKKDFGTITREDTGQKQTTYKGHPLYYFFNDKQVGDTNGQGVNNVWFVLDKKIFE